LEFTPYTLARRLRVSWTEARITKVVRVSARFSKSLAVNQEKVRSTAQRRGKTTKPFMSSLRLTISRRSPRHLCRRRVNLPSVVATIRPGQVKPGESTTDCVGDQAGPVAILDFGRVDDDAHRQPFTVDQSVDFAALDPLAGVITHLAVVTVPFSADLTDWLSRTAAEGLASRPVRSLNAICNSAKTAFQTPSRWNLQKML
jgi:hypothetical protein